MPLLDEASRRRLRDLREWLHDYTRLRWTVIGVYSAIGLGVWWFLGNEIDRLRAKVGAEKHRHAIITELQVQKKFTDALGPNLPAPEGQDLPWWLDQFAMAAQKAGVTLDKALPKPGITKIGPFPVCGFGIEAIGSYQGLVRFVDHVENIKPLVKIDRIDVEELVGDAVRRLTVDMLPGERKASLTITVLMSPKTQ